MHTIIARPATILGFLCAALLGLFPGAPAHAQTPLDKPDVAILPFDRRKLDTELGDTLTDSFQVSFAKASNLAVIGQADIATVLGFEKQKQVIGCDDGSCLAELGGALGVRYVVAGRFSKVGSSYLLIVKLMDVKFARLVLQDQETVGSTDEQKLLEGVQRLAQRFGSAVGTTVRKEMGPAAAAADAAKNGTKPPTKTSPPAASPSAGGETSKASSGPGFGWVKWAGLSVGGFAMWVLSGLASTVIGVVAALYSNSTGGWSLAICGPFACLCGVFSCLGCLGGIGSLIGVGASLGSGGGGGDVEDAPPAKSEPAPKPAAPASKEAPAPAKEAASKPAPAAPKAAVEETDDDSKSTAPVAAPPESTTAPKKEAEAPKAEPAPAAKPPDAKDAAWGETDDINPGKKKKSKKDK